MQKIISALQNLKNLDMLQGEDISERYQHDWSAEKPGLPIAVVRPESSAAVAEILALCSEHKQSVVVQGGLTGLAGGANPREQELAISLDKLTGIEELDEESLTMTVKAGTPLQLIQEAADAAGLVFPLDLGARGTCNIGGNVSTNAGGNQVLRFGMMRNLVLGLETVMANGTIISSMNKMLKNNAAYDLKHLFIGTEGTLGIVTKVVLRLFPKAKSRNSALLALNSLEDSIKLMQLLTRDFGGALSTFEVMWDSYYHFIIDKVESTSSPFDERHPIYVLTEMEGPDEELDQQRFENTLAKAMEVGLVRDAVIATSEREREGFWKIRDGVGDIGWFIKDSANFDVSIPISNMADFLEKIDIELKTEFSDMQKLVFGHIADSNLHIICVTNDRTKTKAIYEVVYRNVGEFNGSVSAEHGIGVQKLDYLHYSRTEAEIALMQQLKQALDPQGILNPGRVLKPD